MILMLKDIPVMEYDLEQMYIKVYRNDLLPFSMRDYVKNTDDSLNWKANIQSFYSLRDFLSSRVLNVSRSNAKVILKSGNLLNALSTDDRIVITETCRGLSMSDAYWLKDKNEKITYNEVDLRKNRLSDITFQISILGKPLTVQRDILIPDIGTQGMFKKTWHREGNHTYLWKTDDMDDKASTKAEIQMSNILNNTNVPHVQYAPHFEHGLLLASCENITNDDISMIYAEDYKNWCKHTGKEFTEEICKINETLFAKMCVIDYIFANTDRHLENISLIMNNNTGEVIDIAPLYDHNQALIADVFGTNIDDLFYDATETNMKIAATTYFEKADLCVAWETLENNQLLNFMGTPLKAKERYEKLQKEIDYER